LKKYRDRGNQGGRIRVVGYVGYREDQWEINFGQRESQKTVFGTLAKLE